MTDLEIARSINPKSIEEVAGTLGIKEYIELYGKYKAKISLDLLDRKNGKSKLVLVTAINPTPMGEGKTTVSISLSDALNRIGKKSILALREPSLGPVFGVKGGAAGGGYSQVLPMEDINLHFTGDFHAITSANNLLCSVIDNHIYQGNVLGIDRVIFKRCLDLNDRQLRVINTGLSEEKNVVPRVDGFDITAASEIMAILCLSKDIDDLKRRLGNIVIGYDKEGREISASDLNVEGAMTVLLKDAIKPNLVQTLEGNPAIIHGGPFANIAHGCNSVIATKMGLKLADYVVTEAGFGADLGAEKFLDIKCHNAGIKPNAIVINATIRSMKYNGGVNKDDINKENLVALEKGICNLKAHILNMQKYTKNIVICLNKFIYDTDREIEFVKKYCEDLGCLFDISTSFVDGGKGAISLAEKVIKLCENDVDYQKLYDYDLPIIDKINIICKEIYHAKEVIISDKVKEKIMDYEKNGFGNLPVCIAKTQYSFTDNQKILGNPVDFSMNVTNVRLSSGAGFIVVLMGSIMTMPGLSKEPAYLNMKFSKNGKISGLY